MVDTQKMTRFHLADPKGGIAISDNSGFVTGVVKDLMKTFLKSIMQAKLGDMMKMRTPAFAHSAHSYLHCLRFELAYLEEMLFLCKKNGHIDDPVERLKYISASQLATIHTAIEY